jgi:hypothetical protein
MQSLRKRLVLKIAYMKSSVEPDKNISSVMDAGDLWGVGKFCEKVAAGAEKG